MLSNYKNRGDEMNDRELLEMAALAYNADNQSWFEYPFEAFRKGFLSNWNPLTDDGDALRLAVALGMEVYIDDHQYGSDCVEAESYTHKSGRFLISLSAGNDKCAATRKAIVMVAAEIGRNME